MEDRMKSWKIIGQQKNLTLNFQQELFTPTNKSRFKPSQNTEQAKETKKTSTKYCSSFFQNLNKENQQKSINCLKEFTTKRQKLMDISQINHPSSVNNEMEKLSSSAHCRTLFSEAISLRNRLFMKNVLGNKVDEHQIKITNEQAEQMYDSKSKDYQNKEKKRQLNSLKQQFLRFKKEVQNELKDQRLLIQKTLKQIKQDYEQKIALFMKNSSQPHEPVFVPLKFKSHVTEKSDFVKNSLHNEQKLNLTIQQLKQQNHNIYDIQNTNPTIKLIGNVNYNKIKNQERNQFYNQKEQQSKLSRKINDGFNKQNIESVKKSNYHNGEYYNVRGVEINRREIR